MTQQNMRVLSIVLMVVGAGLLFWGYQMSGSMGNQVAESITGSSSDAVMYRYIGGAASLIAGLAMFFRK